MGLSKQLFMQIREIEQQVNDGEFDEISGYIYLDEIEREVKRAKDNIKSLAIDKAELNSAKKFEHHGYIVEVCNRSTYDYKHIKSWVDKKKELSEIEKKAKISLEQNMNIDMETGEVYEPAHKQTTTFLKIIKSE